MCCVYVLMVEGVSVVVNVMLSLTGVMHFGSFCFRGELGFLNCDDGCRCVVIKQFELLKFVFNSVYVDLKYNKIALSCIAGSVCLRGVYRHVVLG